MIEFIQTDPSDMLANGNGSKKKTGHTYDDLLALAEAAEVVTPETNRRVEQKFRQQKIPNRIASFCSIPRSLPRTVADYIIEGAQAMGCDESFIALPTLAMFAACTGNSRRIILKASWKEPSILWTAVVAPSGTLKSPALDYALAPIQEMKNANTPITSGVMKNTDGTRPFLMQITRSGKRKDGGRANHRPKNRKSRSRRGMSLTM